MIKLPVWARVVLMFANLILFAILLLGNSLDGLYPFLIYLTAFGIAWLNCGLSYGLLPGKKAIAETKKAQNYHNRTEADAPSAHERAIGYWVWFGCWILALALLTAGYHGQLAGYY